MLVFLGIVLISIAVVLTANTLIGAVLLMIGFILVGLSVVVSPKPKYKERELLHEYELIPIAESVYAIKTCNGKIICKYINDGGEEVIDIVESYWKTVNEIENIDKATIKYYEREPNFGLRTMFLMESRIEVDINIPKGTIIA